ncbi:MAG: hypothetical protein KDD45_13180 [Bdellovibrionales bacterium]|nr:hypothetical protein [Bdellovibrionales bacterium]
MTKKIFLFLMLIFCNFLLMSCSTKETIRDNSQPGIPVSQEEKEIGNIEKFFYLQDRDGFRLAIQKFNKSYPNSVYQLYIDLLNSRVLYQENQLNDALALNEKIQKQAFDVNKKLYYEALFYSSDIYESLGKLDNSLAVLVECEKNNLLLKEKIRLFELPLKLSVAYARLKQNDLSFKYIKQTELGLQTFLSERNQSKKTLSEIYFEIGSGILSPSFFDYYTDANKLNIVYKYLIYCLNLNEQPYAGKAKDQLISQLKSLWDQVQISSDPSTGDRSIDERNRFNKLTHFSKLLNSMQLLEPLKDRQQGQEQRDFFVYLTDLQNETFDEIYSAYQYTPPTEESFNNQIYRKNLKLENVDGK